MVADINLGGTRKFVETLYNFWVEAMRVDITNWAELVEALQGSRNSREGKGDLREAGKGPSLRIGLIFFHRTSLV